MENNSRCARAVWRGLDCILIVLGSPEPSDMEYAKVSPRLFYLCSFPSSEINLILLSSEGLRATLTN